LSHSPKTRIAFHTAMSEDWVLASFDGYDAYLPKPLSGAELVQRVRRLCSGR
jgi:DNA-binding response OmpR family regulator